MLIKAHDDPLLVASCKAGVNDLMVSFLHTSFGMTFQRFYAGANVRG